MAQASESIFQYRTDSGHQLRLPAGNDVGGINGGGVELIGVIDAQFMSGALDVVAVADDTKIFDEWTALEAKVGIPDFQLAFVHDGGGFLVDERNLPLRQQVPDLALNARFVLRSAAGIILKIILAVHDEMKNHTYMNVSVNRIAVGDRFISR